MSSCFRALCLGRFTSFFRVGKDHQRRCWRVLKDKNSERRKIPIFFISICARRILSRSHISVFKLIHTLHVHQTLPSFFNCTSKLFLNTGFELNVCLARTALQLSKKTFNDDKRQSQVRGRENFFLFSSY